MKKLLSLALTLAICLTSLQGCSKDDPIVLSIYGQEFTASQYAYELKNAYGTLSSSFDAEQDALKEAQFEEDPDSVFVREMFDYEVYLEDAKETAIESLTLRAVTLKMIEDNGYEFTKADKETAQGVYDYYKQYYYGGVQATKQVMREDGTTVAEFMQKEYETATYDRMVIDVYGNGLLEGDALYQAYVDQFYNAAHIFYQTVSAGDQIDYMNEDAGTYTEESASTYNKSQYAKAEVALERALSGEDFFELTADSSSEDTSQPEFGYAFQDGGMIDDFNDAVIEMEIGEVRSEVLTSSIGYHVIKRLEPSTDLFENHETDVKSGDSYTKSSDVYNLLVDAEDIPVTYEDIFYIISGTNYEEYLIIER